MHMKSKILVFQRHLRNAVPLGFFAFLYLKPTQDENFRYRFVLNWCFLDCIVDFDMSIGGEFDFFSKNSLSSRVFFKNAVGGFSGGFFP